MRMAACATRIKADGKTLVGEADDVHGDGVGVGAERFAGECGAPGGVLGPGRAVGPPGSVATGARRVDRGPAGEVLEFGAVVSAGREGEGAEQRGLEDEAGIVRGGICGRGEGARPWAGTVRGRALRPR